MGLKRVDMGGWIRVLPAFVGGWVLSGCLPGLDTPTETRNRLREELAAIVPISPRDASKAYLDSGSLSFATDQTNVFTYEGVRDRSQGGYGPGFEDVHLTVNSTPLGDSLEITGTDIFSGPHRIPQPPTHYRMDSLPPTRLGTWNTPSRTYPSDNRAPWGHFLTNDGRRMLYLTQRCRVGDYTYAGEDRLLYLEPYGLIYARVDRSQSMHRDYLEIWLTQWNGETLDRDAIFGMAKGLLAAYPAGPIEPPPLTP